MAQTLKSLPTVPGLPLLGPTRLVTDTIPFMNEVRSYGDVVRVRALGSEFLLVYKPELAEHVLVKEQKRYRKDLYIQRAFRVFGNGLLRAEGDLWLKQRRLIQPGFHKGRIRGYASTMRALADQSVAKQTAGATVDFHEVTSEVTLHIAVETMFGPNAGVSASEVGKHLGVLMARFEHLGYLLEPDWWPSSGQRGFKRAIAGIDRVVEGFIDARSKTPGDDLLSMLLEVRDEQGQPMDRKQVRDEVMTLFLAGHETTALNLVYAWRLLALYPEVAERLYTEVRAAPEVTLEAVMQMPLLDRVIKESLRLYPPAYAIPREAIVDDEACGIAIPMGTQVVIIVNAMHRDPVSFPDPETFNPDRWTPEFEKGLHRYAYFPFGGGPRMCVGAAFADLEAKIVLATYMRAFKPEVLSADPIDAVGSLTQRPRHGVPVRLTRW